MSRGVLLLVGLAACHGDGDSDTITRGDVTCTPHVSDTVNTVLLVDVTGAKGATRVVFGEDGALDHATPARDVAGEATTFDLLGMPSLTDVTWAVEVDGETVCEGTDQTKNLPSDLPEFQVQVWNPDLASDVNYVLIATTGVRQGLFLLDRQGRIVWYRVASEAKVQWVQPYWDRSTVLFNGFDAAHLEDVASITRVDAQGSLLEDRRTVEGHHTFTLLEDDTFAYLRRDKRSWYDPEREIEQPVVGDAIVEQAPDGTERVVFDVWDWLDVRTTPEFYQPFYRDARDWSHANAIHWNPDRGTFLTSLSNLDTIVEIDRESGQPLRWFGIDGENPYGYAEGTRHLGQPHDPRWTSDTTFTVFMTDDALARSGAIEYQIDEDAHVLREIWSYGFGAGEPIHRAFFLGQVWRQPNGNTLIKWAQTGRLVEITPDKQLVWDLRIRSGAIFQEADLVTDLYQERP